MRTKRKPNRVKTKVRRKQKVLRTGLVAGRGQRRGSAETRPVAVASLGGGKKARKATGEADKTTEKTF